MTMATPSASAAGSAYRTRLFRVSATGGAALALVAVLVETDFFFSPGTGDVLGGLAHHVFVLGLFLMFTSASRTVSLSSLGVSWLLGVWAVFPATYLAQKMLVDVSGIGEQGDLFVIWLAPITEELLKVGPFALLLLVTTRAGQRLFSMSDGLLVGFAIGAGVSFQEDAHVEEILSSGDGWGAATPWTMVFPTSSPLDDLFALNHALWGALSCLALGVAVMLRHKPWAWAIAPLGLLLALANHVMANQYTHTEFGTRALLDRASGSEVPWFYQGLRDVTVGGRVIMLVTLVGAIVVAVAELVTIRRLARRDRFFPGLGFRGTSRLLGQAGSPAGAKRLLVADQYARLRRSLYYAIWRALRANSQPDACRSDFARLVALEERLGLTRGVVASAHRPA